MRDRGYRSDRLDGSSEKEDAPGDSDDTATTDTARTTVGMDDYFFQNYVRACKNVSENTSYLEIFNYSDPTYNTVEEHPLTMDEFENFLHRRGAFEPPKIPQGVKLLNGVRIILQLKAKHPETFTPNVISFTASEYESMVRTLHLPYRAIEGTSVVGPFFWCAYDDGYSGGGPGYDDGLDDDDGDDLDDAAAGDSAASDRHLQIIMRKSDVRKKGRTRGWELMLSHRLRTGVTTGYVKGTDSSDMEESIGHLRACAAQVAHPLLLPMIVLSHDLSPKNDQKQRDARDWLRRLEHAVSMRNEIVEDEGYVREHVMDLDQINRDLVECHSQVLWKRPQAYQEIIREMEKGMARFLAGLPRRRGRDSVVRRRVGGGGGGPGGDGDGGGGGGEGGEGGGGARPGRMLVVRDEYGFREVDRCHQSILSRLEFYRNKLVGIENYAHTTLERLAIQRSALYNIIAQKESKLNLQMAADQRRLAHASKRDSTSMKTISLLGAIFLPATLLASIFSMVFFGDDDLTGLKVDPQVWIYIVITIPVTIFIVMIWWIWDRSRERRYAKEDIDLEDQIEGMESKIMATMRRRTMNKVRTWTQAPEKVE